MKLTVLLIFTGLAYSFGSVFSQDTKVNIDVKHGTILDVFDQIESQSEYKVFYKVNGMDLDKRVNVTKTNEAVKDVLDDVLSSVDASYDVVEKIIVIKSNSISQEITVKGKVTDTEGNPLPGVNVLEKGTLNGTITDLDGNFSISVASSDATLSFSFVGFLTEEISVNGETTIDITMVEDIQSLEEVVVIGYGSRQKKDLTGAVSQINSEEITKTANLSPQLAMQGKMTGVYVSNPGSNPNARPTIRIRGVTTLGYNDPLYVIDGIPLTEGGATEASSRFADLRGNVNVLNMINPNDIESISVLKDASATAIYGVRASNGVILITTKRGSKGKAKVSVSAKAGIQNVYKDYDMMNVQQYVAAHQEAWDNNIASNPNTSVYRYYDPTSPFYLGNSETYTQDWVDELKIENAKIQDYNVSVSGGNEISNYAVGAGYSSQENALYYNKFDRYSAFINSDHNLTKYLKVGESFRMVYSNTDNKSGMELYGASEVAPWQPMYDPDGLNGFAYPGRELDGTFVSASYGNSTRSNFRGIGELNTSETDLLRSIGALYAEVSPFKGFRIRGTFSYDYYTNTRENYTDKRSALFNYSTGVIDEDIGNTYGKRVTENVNIVKEFLIGYKNGFGGHYFDIVLNAMNQSVQWNITSTAINNHSTITSWDQRRIDEGWAADDKGMFYERYPSGLQGYMGRLSYNYNSRYYLDATIRRDGTSKFGPGYKWGTFPSVAVAWRLSSENCMTNVKWLDDIKIRAGWGQTGNQETLDFAYVSVVNYNPKYSLGTGTETGDGVIYPAAVLGDFPVKDMSWETVTTSNIGFDAVLLNSSLSLTAEYYYRLTDGILQEIVIPDVIGALESPVVNLAKVDNKGVELMAGYTNKIGELGYNVSFNITTVKNEVLELYRKKPSGDSYGRIEEGQPINFLYGYKTDGIFQSDAEVTEWLNNNEDPGYVSQKSPGDVRFVDIQGAPTEADGEYAYRNLSPDGKIDAYDQTYIGKTIPGYYYGLNMELTYKNFDFGINFRGVGDVQKIYTNGKQSIGAGGTNFITDYLDRWTPENHSHTIPRAIESDPSGNNRISDRHVEDAGFFRFQNFQLGYTFQGGVLERTGFSNLRAYISGTNLFVVSPYSGLDPENDSTPTTFMIGVNFGF